MNNDYLKHYLTTQIATRAIDKVKEQSVKKKDWRTKAFNFRSQSVAKQIKEAQMDRITSNQKMAHLKYK